MTGQSRRLQQVPYGRGKLKLQNKTISLKFYLLLGFLRLIPQTFKKCFLIYFKNSLGRNLKKKKQFFFLVSIFFFANFLKVPTDRIF